MSDPYRDVSQRRFLVGVVGQALPGCSTLKREPRTAHLVQQLSHHKTLPPPSAHDEEAVMTQRRKSRVHPRFTRNASKFGPMQRLSSFFLISEAREARVRAGVTSKQVMVDLAMSIVTLPRK
jgi:hypothetical protein